MTRVADRNDAERLSLSDGAGRGTKKAMFRIVVLILAVTCGSISARADDVVVKLRDRSAAPAKSKPAAKAKPTLKAKAKKAPSRRTATKAKPKRAKAKQAKRESEDDRIRPMP